MGSKKVRGHSKYSFCWWWKPNLETWCLVVQQVNFILKLSVVYSANEDFDSTFKSNEVVYHTGEVNWVPPGIFLASCKMDITYFPFDEQTCYLKVFILTSASFFCSSVPGLITDMLSIYTLLKKMAKVRAFLIKGWAYLRSIYGLINLYTKWWVATLEYTCCPRSHHKSMLPRAIFYRDFLHSSSVSFRCHL